MRKLTSGNKMNFTIFAFIVLAILVILVSAVVIVLKTEKSEYEVANSVSTYDKKYNFVELESSGSVSKKWTGNYYLKEKEKKVEHDLGKYAVIYDKNRNTLDLFGTFYQVLRGGDISKLSEHSKVSTQNENRFYKIDDRKYLIVGESIKNDTGSLSTQGYLIVIVDRLGNALLLNNEINAKTIKEMIISTESFDFDVAKELLIYDNETINLKKIIGSTNEYVEQEKVEEDEEDEEDDDDETQDGTTIINTTNNAQNNSTTIIQNGENQAQTGGSSKQDNRWVEGLNSWIQDVAAGFQSIYNGNSGKKDEGDLAKSITLNGLESGTTYIDINYTIVDPENKYNVVYAQITDGKTNNIISLDKKSSTYRLMNLDPDTNYSVEVGSKIIYADSSVEENVEDTMSVRTKKPTQSLKITKVSTSKIYFTFKLDNDFVYQEGAKLVVYLNDSAKWTSINLTSAILEEAASNGYSGSFDIPKEYKVKNSSITIQLEDTKYNGQDINTNLSAKIINY